MQNPAYKRNNARHGNFKAAICAGFFAVRCVNAPAIRRIGKNWKPAKPVLFSSSFLNSLRAHHSNRLFFQPRTLLDPARRRYADIWIQMQIMRSPIWEARYFRRWRQEYSMCQLCQPGCWKNSVCRIRSIGEKSIRFVSTARWRMFWKVWILLSLTLQLRAGCFAISFFHPLYENHRDTRYSGEFYTACGQDLPDMPDRF